MGGQASEHDISLKTGTVVVSQLDRAKYRVLPIQIRRDGRWLLPQAPLAGGEEWLPQDESALPEGDPSSPSTAEPCTSPSDATTGIPAVHMVGSMPTEEIVSRGIDVVVIALHGRYGEDGCIQGLLEMVGLPYTGSGVLASALAMDKVRAKALVSAYGILTPKWVVVDQDDWRRERKRIIEEISTQFGYPCVAKVPEEGSSFGMGIPHTPEELAAVLDRNIGSRGHMMIEEYIRGREITCAVLGGMPGERPRALPLTEIVPKVSAYFDFEAKYTPGASEEITPARIDEDLTHCAQEIGVRVHEILGCGTHSRSDMIVHERDIYYLETNTIPGMTRTSLYPQAAKAAGMSFSEMLDRHIEIALAWRKKR